MSQGRASGDRKDIRHKKENGGEEIRGEGLMDRTRGGT